MVWYEVTKTVKLYVEDDCNKINTWTENDHSILKFDRISTPASEYKTYSVTYMLRDLLLENAQSGATTSYVYNNTNYNTYTLIASGYGQTIYVCNEFNSLNELETYIQKYYPKIKVGEKIFTSLLDFDDQLGSTV